MVFSSCLDIYPLAVFPHQRCLGWGKTLTEQWGLRLFPVMPAREALLSEHGSDAHCPLYLVRRKQGGWLSRIPRMTKGPLEWALEERRLQTLGYEVLCCWFIADFDTPGHQRLESLPDGGRAWLEEKRKQLEAMPFKFGRYTTRSGGRVIAPLSVPLPPEDFQVLASNMVRTLREGGVQVDPIEHWTAIFRLPRVLRDGVAIRGRVNFFEVAPLDSASYLGMGNTLRPIRVSSTPITPPAPLPANIDPFSLVRWQGAEALREQLLAGLSLGSDGSRYLKTRAAIATVSARMSEPRLDVIQAIFHRTLEATRQEGSITTVEEMPQWMERVVDTDRRRKQAEREDAETLLSSLGCYPVPEEDVQRIAQRELAEAVRGAKRTRGQSSGAYNAGFRVGRIVRWLPDGKVALERLLQASGDESSVRAGFLAGAALPIDLNEELRRAAALRQREAKRREKYA